MYSAFCMYILCYVQGKYVPNRYKKVFVSPENIVKREYAVY